MKIKEGHDAGVHLFVKRIDAHGKKMGKFLLYNNEVVTCNNGVHVPADDNLCSQSLQGTYGTPYFIFPGMRMMC